jgi:hypothetical protein
MLVNNLFMSHYVMRVEWNFTLLKFLSIAFLLCSFRARSDNFHWPFGNWLSACVCVTLQEVCRNGVKLVLYINYTAPSMFTMSVLLCVCRYSLRFRQVHEHWHWHWLCQWTLPFLSVDSAPGGSQDPLQLLYLHVRIHIRHYFIFILLHFVFVTCVLL